MYRWRYLVLALLLAFSAACAPAAKQIVVLPTLASLPTSTPAPTDTPVPTSTPTPTIIPPTATPNLIETQVAQLQATNDLLIQTRDALFTQIAPTATPDASLTPLPTITLTLTATNAPPPVVAMQPQVIYIRSAANLRACASRDCEPAVQLPEGATVTATGTTQGEVIDGVNALWYRVDYVGRELYVYSQLISLSPPTSVPVFVSPPTSAPIIAPPPISLGSCPSLSATCSELTCEQAYACLAAGNTRLDRDHDGIPCESICL